MRVLVTGANGFIGARVQQALQRAGHEVVAAVRSRSAATTSASVACDFSRDVEPQVWLPRLVGIDAVVNCAGILRESGRDRFQAVHVDAPLALFGACAQKGIRRVVQLSALGAPADGEFIASKHRCDEGLAALDLDGVVLRPGLVYSTSGAYGGTALLRAISAWPGLLVLPGDGAQRLRPIAAEDLAEAVVAALAPAGPRRAIIELVGAQTMSLRDYLAAWRRWFGLGSTRVLKTPHWLVATMIAVGEAAGRGPLCRVIGNLLAHGRTGHADAPVHTQALLGRAPLSLDQALRKQPSRPADLLEARWYICRHLLTSVLALVWLASGVAGWVLPLASAQAMWASWPPAAVRAMTLACSGADMVLGIALLTGRATRAVLLLMLVMVVGYTLLIGTLAPEHWLEPFGGLLKNLPIAAVLLVLLALEPRRR